MVIFSPTQLAEGFSVFPVNGGETSACGNGELGLLCASQTKEASELGPVVSQGWWGQLGLGPGQGTYIITHPICVFQSRPVAPNSFLGGRGMEDDWLTYEAKTKEWVVGLTWSRKWGWGGGPQGCVCLALPRGPGAHITLWTFTDTPESGSIRAGDSPGSAEPGDPRF